MISLCPRANFKTGTDVNSVKKLYTIVKDIQSIALEWSRIVPECHPLDYQRLLAIQQSMSHQFRFYYVLHRNEAGHNIGVQYYQYLPFQSAYYDSLMKRNALLRRLEALLVDERFGMLICGSLFSVNAPGFYFSDETGSSTELFQRILQPSADILQTIGRAEIIYKDIPHQLRILFGQHQFEPFDDDVTMTMRIDPEWKSFEDYVSSLKHKYAQRARKIIRAAKDIERRELQAEDIKQYAAEINQLFMQVVNKQSIRLGIPDANYFIAMKAAKPHTFSMCGYFLNHRPVAFASYIVNHQNDELHYIGFDYALNKSHYLYFNILFDGIRKAIENKINILEMGRTAREAKEVVGARPVVFHSFIRFSSPLSKRIYHYLKKRFQQKTELGITERHPFKQEKTA